MVVSLGCAAWLFGSDSTCPRSPCSGAAATERRGIGKARVSTDWQIVPPVHLTDPRGTVPPLAPGELSLGHPLEDPVVAHAKNFRKAFAINIFR